MSHHEEPVSNEIVRGSGISAFAVYPTSDGTVGVAPEGDPSPQPEHLNLGELSVAEIKAYVNSGDLKGEDVYAYESAQDHPRKTLVGLYEPKDESEAPEGVLDGEEVAEYANYENEGGAAAE